MALPLARHRHRPIAPLKPMAALTVPCVIALRVGALQPLHPADQIGFRRLQQQVVVIAHQNKAMEAPARPLPRLAQGAQPELAVAVIGVNGCPWLPRAITW